MGADEATMKDNPTLGYLCEARPIYTTGDQNPDQLCHFPFIYDGVTFTSCAQSLILEINPLNQTWCATKVDSSGVMVVNQWAYCRDERTIIYDYADGHREGMF